MHWIVALLVLRWIHLSEGLHKTTSEPTALALLGKKVYLHSLSVLAEVQSAGYTSRPFPRLSCAFLQLPVIGVGLSLPARPELLKPDVKWQVCE